MFKVNCPGCEAPYQVEERRVPTTGLKMRCPKCGTSFQVDSPSQVAQVAQVAAATSPEPTNPSPKRVPKPTMMGVAPGLGVPPPRRPPPSASEPAAVEEIYEVTSLMPEADDDLPEAIIDPPLPAPPRPFGAPARPAPRAPLGPPARAVAPQAPTAPVQSSTASTGTAEMDLPSPVPPEPGSPRGSLKPQAIEDDLLLPEFGEAALPEPRVRSVPPSIALRPGATNEALGLPTVVAAKVKAPERLASLRPTFGKIDDFELDLPEIPSAEAAVSGGLSAPTFGEFELDDAPLPEVARSPTRARDGEADLPTHSARLPSESRGLAEAALPSLSGQSQAPGLPAHLPAGAVSLPFVQRTEGLPSPSHSLPSPAQSLPAPPDALGQQHALLPDALEALPDFGKMPSLSNRPPPLGVAAGRASQSDLGPFGSQSPNGAAPAFGMDGEFSFDSQPPRASLSNPPFGGPGGFAPLNSPPRESLRSGPDSFGEISLPGADSQPPNSGAEPAPGQTAGRPQLGLIELDTAGTSNRPPANTSVFSSTAPAASSAAIKRVALKSNESDIVPARRALKIAALVFTPLFLGGGALTFVPNIGPFGYYFIGDQLNREAHQALLDATVAEARAAMAKDTFNDGKRAFELVKAAHSKAPREKSFVAYAVFVGFMQKLRFEKAPEIQASAEVLLTELTEQSDIPYLELARAAAGSRENLARPLNQLRDLERREPKNVDVLTMYAEMALRAHKDPALAISAWERARAVEKSARTWFGLARAKHQAGDAVGAKEAAQAALLANPEHCASKVLLAELSWETDEQEGPASVWLSAVVDPKSGASSEEVVRAHTLFGDIHASRSRISQAEKAYEQALKVNPQDAFALIGLGKTLQQAGRHSEALARFEASNQSDADNLKAQIGIAQSKLSLERLDDAEADLKKLHEAHPKEFEVAYWLGRAQDALGRREAAEKSYRQAISLGGGKLRTVSAYVGLVTLLNQLGRDVEAKNILAEAQKSLPNAPAIHRAFGDLASSQGNYDAALTEYRAALALDPKDVGVKFELGVALRRMRRFADALQVFDEVAAADTDHPGLALERGLLFEESGNREQALHAYEQALAKAPTDLDVMLRVGCGKAAAGRGKEASVLLRKVLEVRPNSAETSHCLGRALLVEGNNLSDAQRMLQRAVELDPNRAQYHLYVGWVAADIGQMDKARASFNKALELDKGFADAYWRRGILSARQGAAKDAVADFTEALRLRPSAYDVHAALADSYYDLGMESEALAHWQIALEGRPDEPLWQFRYGRLLVANRQEAPAQSHLERAVALGEKQDPRPRWLWEAHHMLAQALGAVPQAVEHWEQFLRLSPTDSPYRREAIQALGRLGHPWQESQ